MNPFNYVVYQKGNLFFAISESSYLDYSGNDFATVINNASSQLTSGGKILIKSGTYLVSTPVNIPLNVIIEGEGMFNTILKASNNSNSHVILNGNNANNFGVKNLQVQGNSINQTSSGYGISFALGTGQNGFIENCYITDTLQYAIFLANYSNIRVQNCLITNCKSHYILMQNIITDILIDGNRIDGGPSNLGNFGISINSSGGINKRVTISNNHITNTGLEGINLTANTNYYLGDVTIAGNTIENTHDSGIVIYSGCKDIVVSNNKCNNCYYSGIGITTNCSNITITGNLCKNNGQSINTHSGIDIDAGCTDVVCTGNRCYDDQATKTQAYGISEYFTSSSDYDVILGNDCRGNRLGSINSTGPHSIVANNLI